MDLDHLGAGQGQIETLWQVFETSRTCALSSPRSSGVITSAGCACGSALRSAGPPFSRSTGVRCGGASIGVALPVNNPFFSCSSFIFDRKRNFSHFGGGRREQVAVQVALVAVGGRHAQPHRPHLRASGSVNRGCKWMLGYGGSASVQFFCAVQS